MRKSLRYFAVLLTANIISLFVFAQSTTINGNVKNNVTGDMVSSASVIVKGSVPEHLQMIKEILH